MRGRNRTVECQPDMNIRTSTPMAIAPELCDNP